MVIISLGKWHLYCYHDSNDNSHQKKSAHSQI